MIAITTMLLHVAALPIIWMEPVSAGRAVTQEDAIGLCATSDVAARQEAQAMITNGHPGTCASLPGEWHVTRVIQDRCIGDLAGWYLDDRGRKHPSRSCRVEGHVVEVRQAAATRLALIMMTEDQTE